MLSGDAPIVISSQLLNRQDGRDEYHVPSAAMGEGVDPRQASAFDERVLLPQMSYAADGRLGPRLPVRPVGDDDRGRRRPPDRDRAASSRSGSGTRTTSPSWRSGWRPPRAARSGWRRWSPTTPPAGCRCASCPTGAAAPSTAATGRASTTTTPSSASGTTTSGRRADVEVEGEAATQQAIRFNVFSLAQAAARSDQQGVPAKGLTGSGYEGHYFWDTEVYVVPFLSYTLPDVARNVLHYRTRMLPAARERAREMAQSGALFPWRTINGEEASAYYAAGTAAGAHRRRHRVRADEVRPRVRRRGIPGPRRRRPAGRDRADVGGPRLLAHQRRAHPSTSTGSPAPTSTRPSSTTTCSPT